MDMTVTGINPWPSGKGRSAVYLNDKFAFVLYKGELSQYGLEEGSVLDEETIETIMKDTIFPRAKKRAMALLQRMDRTEADVRDKLKQNGYPDEAIDEAVSYLYSYGYLDDARFAGSYIRSRYSSAGRKQITATLMQKGVKKDVIEAAFAQYDEEFCTDGEDPEKELVRKLIKKRCPLGVAGLDYDKRQKLFAYLYGKGFSVSLIEETFSEMNNDDIT